MQGTGQLRTPVDIEVSRASDAAIKAVESIGGRICCVYHNTLGLRALLHPEKFIKLPKQALPTKKRDVGKWICVICMGHTHTHTHTHTITLTLRL